MTLAWSLFLAKYYANLYHMKEQVALAWCWYTRITRKRRTQYPFSHIQKFITLNKSNFWNVPGWFSRYSDQLTGWTTEKLWFVSWQQEETFLPSFQSGSGNHQTSYSTDSGSSVFLRLQQFLSQSINSPNIIEPKIQLLSSEQQAACPYHEPAQACRLSYHVFLRFILVFTLSSIAKSTMWLLSFMFTQQNAVRICLVPHVGHTHLILHFTTAPGKQSETWINNIAKQGATL